MAKQINFDYDGVAYTLEFTRRTIKEMEKRGFKASELGDKPMTMLPMMFEGAFLAHHRHVQPSKIEEIYDSLENKQGLIEALSTMYNEPLQSLIDDVEGATKKTTWTVV